MRTLLLLGSILGIVNSFVLIIYALTTEKGNKQSNRIFAFFIFALTLRISKSIIITYSDEINNFLLTIGLSGFLAIGPAFFFYTRSITSKFQLKWNQLIHLGPAILFIFLWIHIDAIRSFGPAWHLIYRLILLQYMLYVSIAVYQYHKAESIMKKIKNQLDIIAVFLMAIWLAYLLNEVSGFPYISGAVLYSFLIYFTLILVINKGHVINLSAPKYFKTGLSEEENQRLYGELTRLFEDDKIFTDSTISLVKLSKRLHTSTHALSQVINENTGKPFFELLSSYRIESAKQQLTEIGETKISDIAFGVGYNSLSAFNSAFKKSTGLTPSDFRKKYAET